MVSNKVMERNGAPDSTNIWVEQGSRKSSKEQLLALDKAEKRTSGRGNIKRRGKTGGRSYLGRD